MGEKSRKRESLKKERDREGERRREKEEGGK